MLVYYLQMLDTPEEKVRFEQIYLKYRGLMYHVAEDILHNRQDAEDAVSEAVVAAYENIGKLKKEDAFKSWIFTILSNICKKKWRNASKESSHAAEGVLDEASGEETDMGLALDVQKAFFLLEEEEQTIVGMSVFGGYNSQEIGEALKLNPNTVRSKRSRALQKMECVLR